MFIVLNVSPLVAGISLTNIHIFNSTHMETRHATYVQQTTRGLPNGYWFASVEVTTQKHIDGTTICLIFPLVAALIKGAAALTVAGALGAHHAGEQGAQAATLDVKTTPLTFKITEASFDISGFNLSYEIPACSRD